MSESVRVGCRLRVVLAIDGKLLDLALKHNLSVYDASYLALAGINGISLATFDGKLQRVAESLGMDVIQR